AEDVAVALPAEHAVAGDGERRERAAHEVRYDAEVLAGHARRSGRRAHHPEQPLAERELLRLLRGHEVAGPRGGDHELAIEADHVIEADAGEERRGPRHAGAKPGVVAPRHRLPAVDGQTPVLAALRERVGRGAERNVARELLLAC